MKLEDLVSEEEAKPRVLEGEVLPAIDEIIDPTFGIIAVSAPCSDPYAASRRQHLSIVDNIIAAHTKKFLFVVDKDGMARKIPLGASVSGD